VLDAVRLGPGDDEAAVTAAQVRAVIARLIEAGHWRQGDPPILVIFDAGYDLTRLACLLAGLPAQILGRLRADRVLQQAAPPRQPHTRGRPRKHGGQLALADPATWPAPQVTTTTATSRYGTAMAAAWDKVHARLTHRAAWLEHEGPLPVIEGTLIRLQVDHLPGDRDPRPVWLWWSGTSALPAELDRCWQAYLRRFDLERSKPQCCHSRGWPASLLAPSSLVFMSAAWFFSQGRRLCWPRGSWCRVRSRAISAGPARTTVSLAWGCR
jgi:DDE superfamily endonuclease